MKATSRLTRHLLRAARWVPGLYPVLVLITARRVVVRGRSMLPELAPGERAIFDRWAYLAEAPRVGDVVLARHPARPGRLFVKRVAAIIPARDRNAHEYVLLGDNAVESTDSRTLGPFPRSHILGRAWVVYWPPERVRKLTRR